VPTITAATTIDATPAEVFAYAADYRHAAEIVPGLSKFEPVGEETGGLGATYSAVIELGPKRYDATLAVTTYEPDRSIGWRTTTTPAQSMLWTFDGSGAGTSVSFELSVELPGGIAGTLLGVTLDPVLKGRARDAAANLKRGVEAARRA
jgi:carbon monoxide dehydrogenase subunit G